MEDLLEENDFISNRQYNPWKYFGNSCLIGIGSEILVFVILWLLSVYLNLDNVIIGFLAMAYPMAFIFVVVFKKNELLKSTGFDVFMGTLSLIAVLYIPLMAVSVLGGNSIAGAIVLLFIITLIIIFIVAIVFSSRQKKIKKTIKK